MLNSEGNTSYKLKYKKKMKVYWTMTEERKYTSYFCLSIFPLLTMLVLFACISFASSRFSSGSSPFPVAGSFGRFAWFYSLAERMRFVRPSNQFEEASWKGGEDRLRNRTPWSNFSNSSAREINQISVVGIFASFSLFKYKINTYLLNLLFPIVFLIE